LTVLHGVTSQNNITLVEKIIISCLVPIGFITSYILILLRLEGYINISLLLISIPNFVSVFSFYLYTRQLKTVKVAPKIEFPANQEEEDKSEENKLLMPCILFLFQYY